MVIPVSNRSRQGPGKHLKHKWPPGFSVAATKTSTRTCSSGRFQQADHQSIVFDIEFMAFP